MFSCSWNHICCILMYRFYQSELILMNIYCIVFLSFWSRIKRVRNNSQKVEFDKWHTVNTFIKLILKKHSIWNVSLIFLELFIKFLSVDSGADEPSLPKLMWFARDKYFSWKLSEMIFFYFCWIIHWIALV